MRLYDGETVEGYNAIDVEELQREYQDEGMKGMILVMSLTEFRLQSFEKRYHLLTR